MVRFLVARHLKNSETVSLSLPPSSLLPEAINHEELLSASLSQVLNVLFNGSCLDFLGGDVGRKGCYRSLLCLSFCTVSLKSSIPLLFLTIYSQWQHGSCTMVTGDSMAHGHQHDFRQYHRPQVSTWPLDARLWTPAKPMASASIIDIIMVLDGSTDIGHQHGLQSNTVSGHVDALCPFGCVCCPVGQVDIHDLCYLLISMVQAAAKSHVGVCDPVEAQSQVPGPCYHQRS